MEPIIGIIGGSGLDDPELLTGREEKAVKTPFGEPSDKLIIGKISGVKCVLLARHGRKHVLNPTNINYRANIWALKHCGCTCIIVSAAVGSLQANILPGHVVILDQFIDRTTKRASTFYDASCKEFKGVFHIPMAYPFSSEISKVLSNTAQAQGITHHDKGTILVIEGPRFSSKAESLIWKEFGASVVGMTLVPEVVLANELGIPYAGVALVTDMDAWQDSNHPVTVEVVLKQMKENAIKFRSVLIAAIEELKKVDWPEITAKYQTQVDGAHM